MIGYAAWRRAHPQAAADLEGLLASAPWGGAVDPSGKSEAWAQQQARLSIADQGGKSWRNNVGGTKTKQRHTCPKCQFNYQENVPPMRWGLANDSPQLNKVIKSSDLILAIPRTITADLVGSVIAQFGSVECKPYGWVFNPEDPHEQAQLKWLSLIESIGGFARFSTGQVLL